MSMAYFLPFADFDLWPLYGLQKSQKLQNSHFLDLAGHEAAKNQNLKDSYTTIQDNPQRMLQANF